MQKATGRWPSAQCLLVAVLDNLIQRRIETLTLDDTIVEQIDQHEAEGGRSVPVVVAHQQPDNRVEQPDHGTGLLAVLYELRPDARRSVDARSDSGAMAAASPVRHVVPSSPGRSTLACAASPLLARTKAKGPASLQALDLMVAGGCNRTRLQVDANAHQRTTKSFKRTTETLPPNA